MNNRLRLAIMAGLIAAFGLTACQKAEESNTPVAGNEPVSEPEVAVVEAPPKLGSGIELSGINKDVRPQDDFFEYANGTWVAETELPADRARWGAFHALAEKSQEDIRALVEEVSAAEDVQPGSATQKIRDYYNSYMDSAAATERGVEAVRTELDEIAAVETYDDLYRTFSTLDIYGVNSPIGAYIFSDLKDPNTNVLYLRESGITLPDRDYYLLDDEQFVKGRELFRAYMVSLFELAGIDGGADKAEAIYNLEHALAEIHWTKEENRDRVKTYNPRTHAELAEMAPNINWDVNLEGSGIKPRELYIVRQPSFFEAASDIIAATDLATWKDYLAFQTLDRFAPVMGDEFFQTWFEFYRAGLQGIEAPRPKWKRAVNSVNGNMGELLGQLYVDRHYQDESRVRMETMIANLIEAYRQSIIALDWMSEETKQQALVKLSKFTPKIGHPENWRDYSSMEITAGDLAGNVKSAARFEHKRNLDKLDRPVDKKEWMMSPQTVNAYYNSAWNEIVFPAAILQPPFFNVEADDAVNYGGIGAVIGHEIGHGFDDQGRKSDGDGNLQDWWTEEDNVRFEERKNMLAAQYNGYEVIDGLTINGEFTSGENIGDLGGLGIAYKAYHLSLDGKEAPVIDGFTGDQRFFLGWAQVWRGKARDAEAKRLLTVDPHSPAKFRANGAPVNITEFYEAFDVQEGDGMYLPPEERVKIW
jgi:endothelin-converting enzyme/putative endopeptidase